MHIMHFTGVTKAMKNFFFLFSHRPFRIIEGTSSTRRCRRNEKATNIITQMEKKTVLEYNSFTITTADH